MWGGKGEGGEDVKEQLKGTEPGVESMERHVFRRGKDVTKQKKDSEGGRMQKRARRGASLLGLMRLRREGKGTGED